MCCGGAVGTAPRCWTVNRMLAHFSWSILTVKFAINDFKAEILTFRLENL